MNKIQQKQADMIALKLSQKATVDYDKSYAAGFTDKCAEHKTDPYKLLEIAKTLDIHL